jgi:hypothetical protein
MKAIMPERLDGGLRPAFLDQLAEPIEASILAGLIVARNLVQRAR